MFTSAVVAVLSTTSIVSLRVHFFSPGKLRKSQDSQARNKFDERSDRQEASTAEANVATWCLQVYDYLMEEYLEGAKVHAQLDDMDESGPVPIPQITGVDVRDVIKDLHSGEQQDDNPVKHALRHILF